MMAIEFYKLKPTDKDLIEQIANWYFSEWTIPKDRTVSRLTNHPNDDIMFQLVLKKDGTPIATGGLYNNVGLLHDHPKFKKFKPWVALLYTDNANRNKGCGEKLLQKIQDIARKTGLTKLYLFTFTAEGLYKKTGWTQMDRVEYRGHDTVVMEKEL